MRSSLHIVVVIAGLCGVAGCQGLFDLPKPSKESENSSARVSDASLQADSHEILFLDRAEMRQLQAKLAKFGFQPGPVDGIDGPKTIGAIRRYQSAKGLPINGKITRGLINSLDLRQRVHGESATLGASDLPTYRSGTTFIFSNGNVERVIGVNGSVVQWARKDGTSYTTDRNFLMPWSYWASPGERGTATVSLKPDALWPRREGEEVAFSATIRLKHGAASGAIERQVEQWRCRNEGHKTILVRAGRFHTVILVCRRTAKGAEASFVRTWYYAKKIRHYVRIVDKGPDAGIYRKADLVAVRPGTSGWPPIVRAGLMRAVIRALEAREDNAQVHWRSSGVNIDVNIITKAPFSTRDGRKCRRFDETWVEKGLEKRYPGLACRIAPEHWEIPGLENNSAYALAISKGTL